MTNQVVMFMTRHDCGKETKMESDAALEWIAQQCETTYPHEKNTKVDVSKSLNHGVDVHKSWNHH